MILSKINVGGPLFVQDKFLKGVLSGEFV